MKKTMFGMASLVGIALMISAGCRGGVCSNCGAGYNPGYAPVVPQTQGTWAPPGGQVIQPPAGTYVQPGVTTQQPGVVLPQQVAPVQSQPGTVYGNGTR